MGAAVFSRILARTPLKLEHFDDAIRVNARALRNDPLFAAVIGGTGVATLGLLIRQYRELKDDAPAGKLIKGKGQSEKKKKTRKKKKKNPLDKLFWKRIQRIIQICVPGIASHEALLLAVQFSLLMLRTLLTVKLNRINAKFLTQAIARASYRHWARWFISIISWTILGTLTNTGLKYMETVCALHFRKRLTAHLHRLYMRGKGYYHLAVPGAPKKTESIGDEKAGKNSPASGTGKTLISNVDQRIAEDVRLFCDKLAHLYGHSFKPILEFTMIIVETLSELGIGRPFGLYFSLAVLQTLLRTMSPNIGAMIASEQEAEGSFRQAHSRLKAHAEAVAFLDGSRAEERILNNSFNDIYRLRIWHAFRTIVKSAADQTFKFMGITIGGIFIHFPFLAKQDMDPADRIALFRSTEVLMLKSGNSFVEICLLNKQLQTIAGFASRIGELLEALGDSPKTSKTLDVTGDPVFGVPPSSPAAKDKKEGIPPTYIEFKNIAVGAPEPSGKLRVLVCNLDLKVSEGSNVLVTGPNGAGKTSLFRVLAGLWKPIEGTVSKPDNTFIMWLPQDPYLVLGSLRDQVTYPDFYGMGASAPPEIDERVTKALEKAGLSRLVSRSSLGLDQVSPEWRNELSGGEKQRVAFARLFFHSPRFAVLDEATSAVNAKGELELYGQLEKERCTVFSIAHRLSIMKFHSLELEFVGDGSGKYKMYKLIEEVDSVKRVELKSKDAI